jgi:hypothetical protein
MRLIAKFGLINRGSGRRNMSQKSHVDYCPRRQTTNKGLSQNALEPELEASITERRYPPYYIIYMNSGPFQKDDLRVPSLAGCVRESVEQGIEPIWLRLVSSKERVRKSTLFDPWQDRISHIHSYYAAHSESPTLWKLPLTHEA